jgi:ornithine--oxo-acid transaminase
VLEIRGRGLLVGIELAGQRRARDYCTALLERGVLTKDTHDKVIRIAPPLVIEASELDWLVEQLEAVLAH